MLEYTLIDDYPDYNDHVGRPQTCSDVEQELDFLDWPPSDIASSYQDSLDRLIGMLCLEPIPPATEQASDEYRENDCHCHSDRGVYASEKVIHLTIVYCNAAGVKK